MNKSLSIVAILLLILNFGCSLKPMNAEGESTSVDEVKADTIDDILADDSSSNKNEGDMEQTKNSEDEFFKDITKVDNEPIEQKVSTSENTESGSSEKTPKTYDEILASNPKEDDFQETTTSLLVDGQATKTEEVPLKVETLSAPNPGMQDTSSSEVFANHEFKTDYESYQVQRGDTLMLISLKLFGDYRLWKELKNWNQLKSSHVSHGKMIKYLPKLNPVEPFRPSGLPHLVKKGEYLGSISKDKYGTYNRWKEIFENNKKILIDPNLIFAGFTLYYIPDNRGTASDEN